MSSRQRRLTLREARDRKGLGRERVGHLVGISSKTLERYEQANRTKLYIAEKLAVVYGVSVDELKFEAA